MKNLTFKTGLSLALVLFLAGVSVYGQKAEKEISKEYKISKGYTLGIDNKYGAIEVVNWDKNELSVVVNIETEAATKDKADKLLEGITIDINEEKNAVNFKTNFDLPKISGKNQFTVNYTVMTPAYLNVEFSQKYGNIFIQEITGEANIGVKYGNLDAKSLTRTEAGEWNTIEVGYGNVTIEETGKLSSEISYGSFTLSKSVELSIESAYSKLSLGKVVKLDIESKYDKVTAEGVSKSAIIESAYTQVFLGLISAGFEEINAEMSYGNLKGELAPGTSFKIDASTAYGSINVPDGNYNSNKDGNRHTVTGSVGNSPKGEVNVSIRYGDLKLE